MLFWRAIHNFRSLKNRQNDTILTATGVTVLTGEQVVGLILVVSVEHVERSC